MKHIKGYEVFEGVLPDKIKDEVLDILNDLEDEGYNIVTDDYDQGYILITKGRDIDREIIDYSDIKEYCDRISSYLKIEGFKTEVSYGKISTNRDLFYYGVIGDCKSFIFGIDISKINK